MRQFATIDLEDVGEPFFRAFGRVWPVSNFIGRIFAGDVGKRVYLQDDDGGNGFLQVESDEQRDAREAKGDR